MPVISMFYGLIVMMYFRDNQQHHLPHIHVEYQGSESIVTIPTGEFLHGDLPAGKRKLLAAWIELHQEELMADWELAARGESTYKIDPLR
jgi:desulfoferrodoxin (superoxide reductase-like protein)